MKKLFRHRGTGYSVLIVGLMAILALPLGAQQKDGQEGEAGHPEEAGLQLAVLQKQGVVVGKVAVRRLAQTVQATGEIAYDEQARAVITARAAGWVENVRVYSGSPVKQGELLAEIYSPEFTSAQFEYLLILKRQQRESAAGDAADAQTLLAAAQQRLAILGLSEEEIAKLAETQTPLPYQHIHSPIEGKVVEHKVNKGDAIEQGQTLYVIANLGQVWAQIDITESALSQVRVGQAVTVTSEAYPGRRFDGRIISLGTEIHEATRTAKARAVIDNAANRLKPGMFISARLSVGKSDAALVVPDEAVVLMDGKPTVFKRDGEHLEPQAVELGARRGGFAQIRTGLKAGDEVVVKGAYLVKSMLLKAKMGEGHGH